MRAFAVSILLSSSACALWTLPRSGHGAGESTHYSPSDGLVLAPVESSTSAVSLAVIGFRLRNVELDYDVEYTTRDQTFLIEPGRYRVAAVNVGRFEGIAGTDAFTVKSGEVTVLPTLRVYAEGGTFRARFETGASMGREDFGAVFANAPWRDRTWSFIAGSHPTLAAVIRKPRSPSYWSPSQTTQTWSNTPSQSSRSAPAAPRSPR